MRTVLFVCSGNASRSQMAEALFNGLARGAVAMSAGSKPSGKVDPVTIEVMREIGVDIGENKTKPITDEAIEKADLVISMCDYVCPAIGKASEHWDIEDTKGKGIEVVRRVRNEIKRRVEGLLKKLRFD